MTGCGDGSVAPDAAEAPAETLRGLLVWGHEVRELRPCDGEPPVWVTDASGDGVWEVWAALSGDVPGAAVYFELLGRPSAPSSGGFGADYAEQFTVLELRHAHPEGEGPGCADDPGAWIFRAAGNEPFWSVVVTDNGVNLTTPEQPARTFGAPAIGGDDEVIEIAAGGLSLRLARGACRDSMTGAWYPLTASLTLEGTARTGCARRQAE